MYNQLHIQISQAIHGEEKGETTALLLSPSSRALSVVASTDSSRYQPGSQFSMFLTAPVQAFCFLIGISSMNLDKAGPHSHYVPVHVLSPESRSCSDANL